MAKAVPDPACIHRCDAHGCFALPRKARFPIRVRGGHYVPRIYWPVTCPSLARYLRAVCTPRSYDSDGCWILNRETEMIAENEFWLEPNIPPDETLRDVRIWVVARMVELGVDETSGSVHDLVASIVATAERDLPPPDTPPVTRGQWHACCVRKHEDRARLARVDAVDATDAFEDATLELFHAEADARAAKKRDRPASLRELRKAERNVRDAVRDMGATARQYQFERDALLLLDPYPHGLELMRPDA
jgi:hypothetical protein